MVSINAQKKLSYKVKVRVVHKFLPNQPPGAVRVCVLEVKLSRDPGGVALQSIGVPQYDLLYSASMDNIGELVIAE
jgi:hypothetical protein